MDGQVGFLRPCQPHLEGLYDHSMAGRRSGKAGADLAVEEKSRLTQILVGHFDHCWLVYFDP
jgi:hypothetical protein